jgi:hypothetical protein
MAYNNASLSYAAIFAGGLVGFPQSLHKNEIHHFEEVHLLI